MHIAVRPSTLRRGLVALLALVIGAGLLAELVDALLLEERGHAWVHFFSLSYEENLSTWLSSGLLLCCSLVLALVALATHQAGGPYVAHWSLLALGFAWISLDETAQLHEELSTWFDFGGGALYFSWVVPAAALVGALGLAYLRFLAHLPRRVRRRFALAGALYVGGALGVELPLGYWTERAGDENLTYALIDWVEESLEMAGASLFLYALIELAATPGGRLRLALQEVQEGSDGVLRGAGAAPRPAGSAGEGAAGH